MYEITAFTIESVLGGDAKGEGQNSVKTDHEFF